MNIKRTHDAFYLTENYKENPKEYYKMIKEKIEEGGEKEFALIDIGCETGSFLHYMRKCFPKAELIGIDVMEELLQQINVGGQAYTEIRAIQADISDKNTLPAIQADIVTMLGVLSIFDNYITILDNALSLVKENGTLFVFGIFNPKNYDILIKAKKAEEEDGHWESGWNYFSIYSISKYCKERDLKFEFSPFNLNISIDEHKDDPLRSWTVDMADNKKLVINGLQLVHNFYLLKVDKK